MTADHHYRACAYERVLCTLFFWKSSLRNVVVVCLNKIDWQHLREQTLDIWAEVSGILEFGNVWGFVQLIFGPFWPINQLNTSPNIAKLQDSWYLWFWLGLWATVFCRFWLWFRFHRATSRICNISQFYSLRKGKYRLDLAQLLFPAHRQRA